MALKFYFDTHIAKAIAVQLRERGVDVVRCEEVGRAAATDEEHLIDATAENRAVVTHERDFIVLNANWHVQTKSHAGIFYCQPRLQGSVGEMIKQLEEYAQLIESGAGTLEADIIDQIVYLS